MIRTDTAEFDRTVFAFLRTFSPLGSRDIMELMRRSNRQCSADQAYRSLMRLTETGKARHPKRHLWYAVGGRKPKVSSEDRRRLRIVT